MLRRALPLLAILAAGCTDVSTPVAPRAMRPNLNAAVVHLQLMFPVEYSLLNPCNGEEFALTGKVHMEFHVVDDASGGAHVQGTSIMSDVKGVGLVTGTEYVVTYHDVTVENFSNYENGALQETTFLATMNVIGRGEVPNYQFRQRFHITFDENGEPIVEVFRIEEECRGRGAPTPTTG